MSSWQKFRTLSWSERIALIRATCALPVAAVMVRCIGARRSQSVFGWMARAECRIAARLRTQHSNGAGGEATTSRVDEAQSIARMVRVAATRGFISANCLHRSLVLQWLLQAHGIDNEIRFGAHKAELNSRSGEFEAHAWIEHRGHVIGDRPDIRNEFPPFEPSHRAAKVGSSWM